MPRDIGGNSGRRPEQQHQQLHTQEQAEHMLDPAINVQIDDQLQHDRTNKSQANPTEQSGPNVAGADKWEDTKFSDSERSHIASSLKDLKEGKADYTKCPWAKELGETGLKLFEKSFNTHEKQTNGLSAREQIAANKAAKVKDAKVSVPAEAIKVVTADNTPKKNVQPTPETHLTDYANTPRQPEQTLANNQQHKTTHIEQSTIITAVQAAETIQKYLPNASETVEFRISQPEVTKIDTVAIADISLSDLPTLVTDAFAQDTLAQRQIKNTDELIKHTVVYEAPYAAPELKFNEPIQNTLQKEKTPYTQPEIQIAQNERSEFTVKKSATESEPIEVVDDLSALWDMLKTFEQPEDAGIVTLDSNVTTYENVTDTPAQAKDGEFTLQINDPETLLQLSFKEFLDAYATIQNTTIVATETELVNTAATIDVQTDFTSAETPSAEKPLQNNLAELAQIEVNGTIGSNPEIKEAIQKLNVIFDRAISNNKLVVTPELASHLLELLQKLGYQNPNKVLQDFMTQHDLEFLVQAVRYLALLTNADNRQELLQASAQNHSLFGIYTGSKLGKLVLQIAHGQFGYKIPDLAQAA